MSALAITTTDDGVRWIRLDRPESRNAIDLATQAELSEALADVATDDDVRALVLDRYRPGVLRGRRPVPVRR